MQGKQRQKNRRAQERKEERKGETNSSSFFPRLTLRARTKADAAPMSPLATRFRTASRSMPRDGSRCSAALLQVAVELPSSRAARATSAGDTGCCSTSVATARADLSLGRRRSGSRFGPDRLLLEVPMLLMALRVGAPPACAWL